MNSLELSIGADGGPWQAVPLYPLEGTPPADPLDPAAAKPLSGRAQEIWGNLGIWLLPMGSIVTSLGKHKVLPHGRNVIHN